MDIGCYFDIVGLIEAEVTGFVISVDTKLRADVTGKLINEN